MILVEKERVNRRESEERDSVRQGESVWGRVCEREKESVCKRESESVCGEKVFGSEGVREGESM